MISDPFFKMPPELACKALEDLDIRSIAHCMEVCKKWKTIALNGELWRNKLTGKISLPKDENAYEIFKEIMRDKYLMDSLDIFVRKTLEFFASTASIQNCVFECFSLNNPDSPFVILKHHLTNDKSEKKHTKFAILELGDDPPYTTATRAARKQFTLEFNLNNAPSSLEGMDKKILETMKQRLNKEEVNQ